MDVIVDIVERLVMVFFAVILAAILLGGLVDAIREIVAKRKED